MLLSLQTRPYTICCCPCRQGPIQYVFVPADKALYNMFFPCRQGPIQYVVVPADKALSGVTVILKIGFDS
jgi:hypothetical protein